MVNIFPAKENTITRFFARKIGGNIPQNSGNKFDRIKMIHPFMLLFDDIKIKMARKSGMKQKENPVGCTEEGKR